MSLYNTIRPCKLCGEEKPTNFPGHCRDCDPYASEAGLCLKCNEESYLDDNRLCNPCSHGIKPPRKPSVRTT